MGCDSGCEKHHGCCFCRGLPGFPGPPGATGATGATGPAGNGIVYLNGDINSYILSAQSILFGLSFAGTNQPTALSAGNFSTVSSLPATITMNLGNHIGSTGMVFPVSGHIQSLIASFYTEDTDPDSGNVAPIVAIYHQPLGTNGQNTGNFVATGIGNQVVAGVTEPAGTPTLTTTLVPSTGSYAVTAGDRYLLVLATNSWGHILTVSVQVIVSVP